MKHGLLFSLKSGAASVKISTQNILKVETILTACQLFVWYICPHYTQF